MERILEDEGEDKEWMKKLESTRKRARNEEKEWKSMKDVEIRIGGHKEVKECEWMNV